MKTVFWITRKGKKAITIKKVRIKLRQTTFDKNIQTWLEEDLEE